MGPLFPCHRIAIAIALSMLGACDAVEEGSSGELLFSPEQLPSIHLLLPSESYDRLADCTRKQNNRMIPPDHCRYQWADFRYVTADGVELAFDGVGLRLKGRASFQRLRDGNKPSFKIKFNEVVAGGRFLGLRRLTLNNMIQDPTMMHECLSYRLFRAAGIPAPRCNHARVYLNGEYLGLYANVETLDESFLGRHFQRTPGNLYETYADIYFTDLDRGHDRGQAGAAQEARFQLETNEQESDRSDLARLLDAIYSPMPGDNPDDFVGDVEGIIDLDEFLAVGAIQAIIADWDGFFGARNNYKVYHDLDGDRFLLFPWGTDQTFVNQGYRIDHTNSGRTRAYLFLRCLHSSECTERYLAAVADALEIWRDLDLGDDMELTWEVIADAAETDPNRAYDVEEMTRKRAGLRSFLADRGDGVARQLAGE